MATAIDEETDASASPGFDAVARKAYGLAMESFGSQRRPGRGANAPGKPPLPPFVGEWADGRQGEHRYFSVTGDGVRYPGQKPCFPDPTVSKAIEFAGGFAEHALTPKVRVVRAAGKAVTIDVAAIRAGKAPDVGVRPDDVIQVDARPSVQVHDGKPR